MPSQPFAGRKLYNPGDVSLENQSLLAKSVSDNIYGEIHLLAARLRAEFGELDDAAIQAVSEATGAPEDFVRIAIQSAPGYEKRTFFDRVKASFLAFDPDLRRYTMAGVLAAMSGLAFPIAAAVRDNSGFLGTVGLLGMLGALWNAAISKNARVGAISGALYGLATFVLMTFATMLFKMIPFVAIKGPAAGFVILWVAVGALAGSLVQLIFSSSRAKLGLKDPSKERIELLQQLQDIQEKLKSDERFVTFMSVDVVGSTRLKTENDPLTVEFTFHEYHRFVASVAERYGGQVHSTAGDGVTCVFESPQMAYAAGRALLAGLFEFNSFRNRLAKPIEIRAGIHTGSAHVPGQDIANLNFAHVIDVAAHMQKAAQPGGLMVSETTCGYLPGGMEAVGTDKSVVQDLQAVEWRPRVSVAPLMAVPES